MKFILVYLLLFFVGEGGGLGLRGCGVAEFNLIGLGLVLQGCGAFFPKVSGA